MGPEAGVTWLVAAGAASTTVLLLAVPGWIVARALGFSGLDRLGLAAPLGVALVLAAGSAVDLAGLAWTRGVSAAALVVATSVAVLASRWGARRVPPPDSEPLRTPWAGAVAGVSIALVGTVWKVLEAIPRPAALSQEPDAQFHLLAITHLLDLKSASPVRSGEVHFYDPSFYPGGFHSIAATVSTWTGVDAVVAAHVVLVLSAGLIWPLGVVALAARTASRSGWVLASAGALALTAVLAPISMLSIGGAWANLMSAALIPGALLPLAAFASAKEAPGLRSSMAAAIPVVAVTAAATLAQPNAAYTIALLSAAMMAPVALRWGRVWTVTYLIGLVAIVVCWVVPVNPVMLNVPVTVDSSNRRAVLVLLKNGDVPLWSGAAVALLTLSGAVVGLRRGRLQAGVALMWLATAAVALVLQLGDVMPVARVTWPWFSGYARIATMLSLTVVLVSSLAIAALMDRIQRRSVRGGVLAGAAVVAGLTVAALPAVASGERLAAASYDPLSRHAFVTPEEAADLQALSRELTPADTVALDPARGGVFLGLHGPRVVPVGPFYEWTPSIRAVATRLDEAANDETVCAAARDLGVTHVLAGGDRADTFTEVPAYPGIDRTSPGADFRLVASEGPYRLYSTPSSCGPDTRSR